MHTCDHRRSLIKVGTYAITASGTRYLMANKYRDLLDYDVVIPLERKFELPFSFGREICLLTANIEDFQPPPKGWKEFLETKVIPKLAAGKRLITFCIGSHGRTGTMIASLIALLESEQETPDPIWAARERHCRHAVETSAQAEAVFALRGQSLPNKYRWM